MAQRKKGCFSQKDITKMGRLLEDEMVERSDMIQEAIEHAKTQQEKDSLDGLGDRNEKLFQDLFIKVKFNACNPRSDFDDRWIDLFRKGAVPWS